MNGIGILETIDAARAESELAYATVKANTAFSKLTPFLQLAWDSTSLGALKTCPRYYYYSIVLGLVPREESIHLRFGLEFHSALELYDRRKAMGDDHTTALLAAVRQALISTWNTTLKRPWASDEPSKNRETLIRAIVWYLDQFEHDPLVTLIRPNGQPAVELSFRMDLDIATEARSQCEDCVGDGHSSCDDDRNPITCETCGGSGYVHETFMLCGHLDRVVIWNDRLWVVDRKTTKGAIGDEYFAKYSPDNQMSCYATGGQFVLHEPIAGLIIDAGQTGATFTRFQRGIVTRTPDQLKEWMNDLVIWLRMAEAFARLQYWPQNDKACNMYSSYSGEHDLWKGGCPYREVCGSSPGIREAKLKALYVRRTWDPLVTREV